MKSKLVILLMWMAAPLLSQGAQVDVPDALQGWERWVAQGYEYRRCPFFFDRDAEDRDNFVCAWPGQLTLDIDADGGRFSQTWTVYEEDAWLQLPGDAAHWPDAVTVDGSAALVVDRLGSPAVRLAPGRYRIQGSFAWNERPGILRVPESIGLIRLSVDGNRVERPERNGSGLFLGERQRDTRTRDSIDAEVYRMVHDEVPTRLTTLLRIDVAGGVREELFGPVLPDGFVPMTIDSQLPARLEADGQLRVQVRPGRWEIALGARADAVLNDVGLGEAGSNLPRTEIWSYMANERLRVTAADGAPPVDPRQAQVPPNWQHLPAFRLDAGGVLTINERSRGNVATENDLNLDRTLWLDFDGGGFVVRDRITGTMRSEWRLDMAPPYRLLSAVEAGESLLITNGNEPGQTGVELRQSGLQLNGIGRSDTRASMPVSGWDARFASVGTRLNLPPGHKLLAAPGARAPGSWVSQWQLLDFFLVLIITIAAWRLFGRSAGIIALLALTLSFHEIDAPAWLWLNLLVAIALMRVAPPGRLRQAVLAYQGVSVVLLVIMLVPFVAGQLRIAIYPQLEPQYGADYSPSVFPAAQVQEDVQFEAPARTSERQVMLGRDAAAPEILEEITVTGSKSQAIYSARRYSRFAPNAIVQAGPGVPSWQWNSYRLHFSGPVDADQAMRLVILPRWAVTLLRFLAVFMLLFFTAVLAAEILKRRWTLPGGLRLGGANAAGTAAIAAILMSVAPTADAQLPDSALLDELRTRLLAPPDCVPRCAEIVAADVKVSGESVSMSLIVNALEDVAIPLPGAEQGWRPQAVMLDGTSAGQVVRGSARQLWLLVTPGRHTVTLRGATPSADNLEIPFPTPPRVIAVEADGWFVAGIKDRRLLAGSLQLTRLQTGQDDSGTPRWEASRFPTFVRIERNIELDLDWGVRTTVIREAPLQGALTIEVPLIDGEAVLTEDMTVEDGKLLVSMNPNQRAISWVSTLPRKTPLALTVGAGSPWKEVWRFGIGGVWHAQFDGVPESETQGGGQGARVSEFHPRGGESLTMATTRPEAVEGTTLAFDAVDLSVSQGERSRTARLTLSYRSTRGAQHVVRLPEGAEVTEVRIDGRVEPLRADGRLLNLPILPGEHSILVSWRNGVAASASTRVPEVDVGAPSGNIRLQVSLPENRWLLATSGPRLGPAVLYWPELAVLVLFSLILGRIGLTPLETRHWLLLGLGFSTFNWPVLGLVVLWLLSSGARERWRSHIPWWRYNTMQVLFAGFTVVALLSIVFSLPGGLLGTPDMHVTGNGSFGNSLTWFADASKAVLPNAMAWSVPLWTYKVLILAWALWLSFALLRWLPWVWQCFAQDGFWRSRKGDAIESTAEQA